MTFESLKGKRILVTGGAGFIGSNLVNDLLSLGAMVRVMDNFETGHIKNLEPFIANSNFELFEGDIRNPEDCQYAAKDMDMVSHQAALGSVPRSIEFPQNTHAVNATGFLNMLHAAKEAGINRFVYASSSSVYGDSFESPKREGQEGNLLSPYAVTKALNEQYAAVYHRLHEMETIGFRYFNVFGPNQDPNGVYAAAIPKFIDKMMNGGEISVHGDGEQTRDFTYVRNAVRANLLGLSTENRQVFGAVFNVACGSSYSLNYVLEAIKGQLVEEGLYNSGSTITYGPKRKGDIQDSLADISSIQVKLNYSDAVAFEEGLKLYIQKFTR
jgi:nucleoside-diphosphate-sugar epimerase